MIDTVSGGGEEEIPICTNQISGFKMGLVNTFWALSLNPQRPPSCGQPRGFWQFSDIPPRWLWQWCSDPGAFLRFKIKWFPPPGVGNRVDSDTKGANEGGDFDRGNFQMSESLSWVRRGEPQWFTLTGAQYLTRNIKSFHCFSDRCHILICKEVYVIYTIHCNAIFPSCQHGQVR